MPINAMLIIKLPQVEARQLKICLMHGRKNPSNVSFAHIFKLVRVETVVSSEHEPPGDPVMLLTARTPLLLLEISLGQHLLGHVQLGPDTHALHHVVRLGDPQLQGLTAPLGDPRLQHTLPIRPKPIPHHKNTAANQNNIKDHEKQNRLPKK